MHALMETGCTWYTNSNDHSSEWQWLRSQLLSRHCAGGLQCSGNTNVCSSQNNTNINNRFIHVVLNLFHRTLSDRFVLIITTFYLPKARMVLYYFYEPHSYCSSPLKILPRHIESNGIAHPSRPTAEGCGCCPESRAISNMLEFNKRHSLLTSSHHFAGCMNCGQQSPQQLLLVYHPLYSQKFYPKVRGFCHCVEYVIEIRHFQAKYISPMHAHLKIDKIFYYNGKSISCKCINIIYKMQCVCMDKRVNLRKMWKWT